MLTFCGLSFGAPHHHRYIQRLLIDGSHDYDDSLSPHCERLRWVRQTQRIDMPINLRPSDVSADLETVSSVLIVSCPVCPTISLAMQNDSPLVDVFKSGFKTGAFEDYIQQIRDPLEKRGVRTGVFTMRLPLPTMCLWTKGQRNRLLKKAKDYEAVLVLGCDSAAYTANQALENTGCRVIQGMQMVGITNATVGYQFPMTFELREKTRVQLSDDQARERHDDGQQSAR